MGPGQGLTRLFYDGNCGLCRGAVRFVARHERSGGIRFTPLGGATFQRSVPTHLRTGLPDSLVVITPDGSLLVLSEAVIHLLGRMGPVWSLVVALAIWVPKSLRDRAYRLMARMRPAGRACATVISPLDERFEP
jgi:predicted DCC family thiol-disulfide oxidoreductase YuxK